LRLFSERWPLCGCPPTRRRRRITLHGHSRRSTKSLATGTAPQSGGTIWAAEHVLSLSVVRWKKSQRSSVSPRAGNAAEHPAIAGPCRFEGNHFSVLDRRRSGLFCSGEERRERERERERRREENEAKQQRKRAKLELVFVSTTTNETRHGAGRLIVRRYDTIYVQPPLQAHRSRRPCCLPCKRRRNSPHLEWP
jgi:hypothetical protein